MTGDGFPTALPFVDAVRRHAALRGQVMQAIPAQQSRFRAVVTCSRPGSQGCRPAAKSQPMCICCCTRITMATTLAKWPPMIPRERCASRSVTRTSCRPRTEAATPSGAHFPDLTGHHPASKSANPGNRLPFQLVKLRRVQPSAVRHPSPERNHKSTIARPARYGVTQINADWPIKRDDADIVITWRLAQRTGN